MLQDLELILHVLFIHKRKEMTVNFSKKKETPNTVQYAEDSDNPIVGTLYIKKTNDLSKADKLVVEIKAG